jgi:hypothetical protein
MSRELVRYEGDEKQLVNVNTSTLVAFANVASSEIVQSIITSDNKKAQELVASLTSIHSEIIGLGGDEIRQLFKSYKERALVLFEDDPESRAAIVKLISMASQMVYYLHMNERQITVSETREQAFLQSAESPVRVIQEHRQTFYVESALSALLAGGVSWLGKDLINHGISFGQSMANAVSDPFNYCVSKELVPDTSILASVSSIWSSSRPTISVDVRQSGVICDALGVISGGMNNVVEFASTSNKFSFMILFMVLFVLLMAIFRIMRYSGISVLGARFSGMRADDLMESIEEMTNERISPRRLSPRRISPRRLSPRRLSPRRLSPRRISPRRLSPRRLSSRHLSPRRLSRPLRIQRLSR